MFNEESRTKNVVRASFVGAVCNIVNIVLGFIYRTIFIRILSTNYLGINGLFENIITILSFADLGIGSAITFRFYKPISNKDVQKVGELMNFYKRVYNVIAMVILTGGLCFLPFLNFFIKDTGELPQDIHLSFIYLLFLFQSVSSYLFVYKQTILSVDQKQYIVSLAQTFITFVRYIFQLYVLVLTHNYIWTFVINIFLCLCMNFLFSEWASHKYKDVFEVKETITKEEKTEIWKDTKATLCHKIGGTVLTSTDNIILSKYVGIIATGMYSNYSMIFSHLSGMLNTIFGSFTATLGNAHVKQKEEEKYISYKRLLFGNFWVISICTICLYNLLNDFIVIWVGENMVLDDLTVTVLCIQFFMENARILSMSYINGSGLFVKDKIRPLIEASINLVVSIFATKRIGIAGVFLGTIISHLCTVFWREPYLLYKYEFKKSMKEYWMMYGVTMLLTIVLSISLKSLMNLFFLQVSSFFSWGIKAFLLFLTANVIFVICFYKNEYFVFYKSMLYEKWKGRGL